MFSSFSTAMKTKQKRKQRQEHHESPGTCAVAGNFLYGEWSPGQNDIEVGRISHAADFHADHGALRWQQIRLVFVKDAHFLQVTRHTCDDDEEMSNMKCQ